MPYQLIDTVTPDVGAKTGADKINNNAIQAQYQGGYFTVGGTANAITLTSTTGAPSGYATGQEFYCRLTSTNTGAATVNVDGLGAKTIKTVTGADLPAGYLSTTVDTFFRYDGVNMVANTSLGTLDDQVPTNSDLSPTVSGTASFSSDVYTFTPTGGYPELKAGIIISFVLPSGSVNTTTSPTINYDGSSYDADYADSSSFAVGDLNATYNKQVVNFRYNGASFVLVSDLSGTNANGAWVKKACGKVVVSGKTDLSIASTTVGGVDTKALTLAKTLSTTTDATFITSLSGVTADWTTPAERGNFTVMGRINSVSSADILFYRIIAGSATDGAAYFEINGRWY